MTSEPHKRSMPQKILGHVCICDDNDLPIDPQKNLFDGFMVVYGGFMVFYGGLMGFYGIEWDLMGFTRPGKHTKNSMEKWSPLKQWVNPLFLWTIFQFANMNTPCLAPKQESFGLIFSWLDLGGVSSSQPEVVRA